jgi:hypothetical protein
MRAAVTPVLDQFHPRNAIAFPKVQHGECHFVGGLIRLIGMIDRHPLPDDDAFEHDR